MCERATDYVNPRFLRWIPIPSLKLQANNYCVACSYYVFFFLLLSRSVCCTSHRNLMSSCRAHSQLTVVHEPASRNGRISCPPSFSLIVCTMYTVYSVLLCIALFSSSGQNPHKSSDHPSWEILIRPCLWQKRKKKENHTHGNLGCLAWAWMEEMLPPVSPMQYYFKSS